MLEPIVTMTAAAIQLCAAFNVEPCTDQALGYFWASRSHGTHFSMNVPIDHELAAADLAHCTHVSTYRYRMEDTAHWSLGGRTYICVR